MTRPCSTCQGPGARKRGCGCRVCDRCLADGHGKTCPTSLRLRAMTPADVLAWKRANEPEQTLTTEVIEALNKLAGVEVWQARRRGGVQANDARSGVPDVIGWSRHGGIFVAVETKRAHPDQHDCPSCNAQRDFGERLVADGGVYVGGVRNVQQAVDGVRMGLARRRGVPRGNEAAG